MAEFNPKTQDMGVSNYVNASQGTGPNRTFEALFSGLTNTLGNVTQVRDEATQRDIERDATSMFENVNREFGFDPEGTTPDGTGSDVFSLGVGESMPPGMGTDLQQLASLQLARNQRKITETNYYGRLAMLSKQLRQKYPRYESIVDRTIQSVTGTRPANAYRDAILAEMNALAGQASDEEKFKRQWEKQNEAELSVLYGDDYFLNPAKYDFDQVQAQVAGLKANKYRIDAEVSRLNLVSKTGEVSDQQIDKAMSQDFGFIVESSLNKAIGANQPSFQQTLNDFIAGGAKPENLNNLIQQLSLSENELRTTLRMKGMRDYGGMISTDKLNKQIDAALYPIQQAKEAILGGDFKLAAKFATISKAISDNQYSEMLTASPELRVGAGLRQVSQVSADEFLLQHVGPIETLGMEIAGRSMLGDTGIVKKVVETGDSKTAATVVKNNFDLLRNSEASGENFSNLVESMFGTSAPDWMDPRVVDKNDMEGFYFQALDPQITKSIAEKGTPQDLQKYTDWAIEKALALPVFRSAAGNVNSLLPSGTYVAYDEGSGKFVLAGEGPDALPGEFNNLRSMSGARAAIGTLNRAFAVLDPIIEANRDNGDEVKMRLLRDLNVEQEAADRDGFFRNLLDAFTNPEQAEGDDGEAISKQLFDGAVDFLSSGSGIVGTGGPVGKGEPVSGSGRISNPDGLKTSNARGYSPDIENLRPELKSGLESLQQAWGRELPIVSGYRDPVRNRKAGGARRSQHMHGNAVDIDVRNLSIKERQDLIRLARSQGFTGIGVYANSLHLDKGGTRHWGPSYKSASTPKWALAALGD